MSNLEKAQKNLEAIDIWSKIENDCLYVSIDSVYLELSEFEVNYQANEFDERDKENEE